MEAKMAEIIPPYPIPTEGLQDDSVTKPKIKDGEIVNDDINAAAAIASSKLAAEKIHIFIPYSGKIADINEDDTDTHLLDLETALSETRKIIAVILDYSRTSGSGIMYTYPNEGTIPLKVGWIGQGNFVVIADGTQRVMYKQSVANDDFDLYCLGYVVEV